MTYSYYTPAQMAEQAGKDVSYFTTREIPDSCTWATLQGFLNAGRVSILETQGNLVYINYTNYYYTEAGKLKIDDETGAAVMDPPIQKWITIT